MSSSKSKKHADKSKHKVRSRYVSSSSEEDQSSVTRHRSSKPSGAISDQDQPQHDPDPPYYREVALSDVSSQYAEEVDTFRCILSLPDPRESMPSLIQILQKSVLLLNPLGLLWARFPYQFLRNWNTKLGKTYRHSTLLLPLPRLHSL